MATAMAAAGGDSGGGGGGNGNGNGNGNGGQRWAVAAWARYFLLNEGWDYKVGGLRRPFATVPNE
ncbi:MAG: hypothetical protein JWL65_929 [Gammaproteobacteria bacterium]|nr:hypothetical protein [Gammaproteobacteria bacterium]